MKYHLTTRPFAASASALLLLAIAASPCLAEPYRWVEDDAAHSVQLQHGEKPLVRYMHAPLDDSSDQRRGETYKPYLHVYSPDGLQLLTKGPGGLFPHHRGIFFGFNKITYSDGKKCDTWHCHGKAYQQHERFAALEADDEGGQMVSIVEWHGADGEVFATEEREQAVQLTGGMLQIDFASTLTPAAGVGTIQLDGDPQHAGVQFRSSQKVADETAKQTYYLRTDGLGKPGETRNWNHNNKNDAMNGETTNRPWLAISIVIDGERYTVLYLDHPDNPKPSHYSERDYGRFGSFFVADVTTDEPLNVHYRYVVKQGEMSVEECQSLYDAYVGELVATPAG